MKKKIESFKKQIKKLKKKHRVGFTLVEVLAVIVVLGIIMVLATPSVLSTIDVAKKKSFMAFVQKVATKGQAQYLIDSSTEEIIDYFAVEYVYDIETDLDLENIGTYKGMYMHVFCVDNNEGWCWVDKYSKEDRDVIFIFNDEFLYSGYLDKEIKESNIMSFTALPVEAQNLFKSVSMKQFYAQNESLNMCGGEKYIVNGGKDASGNKFSILAHTTRYDDNYNEDGSCKYQNPAYFSM